MEDTMLEIQQNLLDNPTINFKYNNKNYVLLSSKSEDERFNNVYFVRYNIVNGKKVLEDIESDEEYDSVLEYFSKMIKKFDWNENFDSFMNSNEGEN